MAFLKHLLPAWKRGIEDKRSTNAAILSALHGELSTAEKEAMKSKVLMSLDTSTGEWLDAYGRLFGVLRRDEEVDDSYRKRIIGYILLRRGTIPSIIEAIQNFLQDEDAQVEIYEPHNNIFYLNRSKLNGPDHLLGEYYTFAVIDIKISRPFSPAVMDVINEFKPAGVTVRLTYRPQPKTGEDELGYVELPLSNSEIGDNYSKIASMNGMNERIRGHLNLTEGVVFDKGNQFTLNESHLNSNDRLTGSFETINPSYNLASFSSNDLMFSTDDSIGDIAQRTIGVSADFYSKTGSLANGYAVQAVDSVQSNYLYLTMDLFTYLERNYPKQLRAVKPNGIYTKGTYLSMVDSPSVLYSVKATLPKTTAVPIAVQMLNFSSGEWEDVDEQDVYFSQVTKKVRITDLTDFVSDSGLVLTRLKTAALRNKQLPEAIDYSEVNKPLESIENLAFSGGSFDEDNPTLTVQGGSFDSPSTSTIISNSSEPVEPVEPYSLHIHFFELSFKKEIGVSETIVALYSEVRSTTITSDSASPTKRSFDGGSFTGTSTKTISGGEF